MVSQTVNGGVAAQAAAYYRHPHVHARLLEYCGDEGDGTPSAVFVAGFDGDRERFPTWQDAQVLPAASLPGLLDRGCDVARSLWDTRSLIFLIDLDYQNVDYPGEPFIHVAPVFFKLEPTYAATLAVLESAGIAPLTTVSGRGYHFVGRIPLDAPVIDALADLGGVPNWYVRHSTGAFRSGLPAMTDRQAAASEGLGLVIEYLAHSILRGVDAHSLVPVVLNGTTVGSGIVGRECVSIDFSHVGDPLDVRHVRMGFSTYQWHRSRPDIFGSTVAARPPLACVPRTSQSLDQLLRGGRTLEDAARTAVTVRNVLPDVSAGIQRAVDSYRTSRLAAFHRQFASELRSTSTRRDLDAPDDLPPCISRPLAQPNDLLLKPEYLQNLVRGLSARGWTAARIARLVSREYMNDYGWGNRWRFLDAQTRARFDVRVFAGLIATDADQLTDFNCVSSQEKGVCPRSGCLHDLRIDRDRLLRRSTS